LPNVSDPSNSVLALRDVRVSFSLPDGTRRDILDIGSLHLARGERMGLRGASGSGKTTLLNVIGGLIAPQAGSITVAGVAIGKLAEAKRDAHRARHLGIVFQQSLLLQGTSALDNVLLPMMLAGKVDRARGVSLLQRVGLSERLHDPPRRLSIGQQQRVAIARAVANKPDLVMADEPTGNLDPDAARAAMDLLLEVSAESGAALLVVSHDPATLARFDRVEDLAQLQRAKVVA